MCIDETSELVLDCQAVGLPVPILSWYRNGQLIDQNPDFKITQLAGSGILRVRIHILSFLFVLIL